jgi:hypothetical protein
MGLERGTALHSKESIMKFLAFLVFIVFSSAYADFCKAGGWFNLLEEPIPEIEGFDGSSYVYPEISLQDDGYIVTFSFLKENEWVLVDTYPSYGSHPKNINLAVKDNDGDGSVAVFFGKNITSFFAEKVIGPEISGSEFLAFSAKRISLAGIPKTTNCEGLSCEVRGVGQDVWLQISAEDRRYVAKCDYSNPVIAEPIATFDNQLGVISVDIPQFSLRDGESVGVVVEYFCYDSPPGESEVFFYRVPEDLAVSSEEEKRNTPDVGRIPYSRKCPGMIRDEHYSVKVRFVLFTGDWGLFSDPTTKKTGSYQP